LFIDEMRLKQILLNFLTNALKFTESGSITLKIEEFDQTMKFSVIDTGKGIPQNDKSKIFQPFNQINKEDASRHSGIGLGLYLCKMLSTCMNGKIGFESEFKKGSTFWVEFQKKVLKESDV
jgi:signal transduction histidine kinase